MAALSERGHNCGRKLGHYGGGGVTLLRTAWDGGALLRRLALVWQGSGRASRRARALQRPGVTSVHIISVSRLDHVPETTLSTRRKGTGMTVRAMVHDYARSRQATRLRVRGRHEFERFRP